MFSEHGFKQLLREPICYEENFSLQYIEELAYHQVQDYKKPQFVYLSENLYKKILLTYNPGSYYDLSPSHHILTIYTSIGPLRVECVRHLENFCHVGEETSIEQIEWIKIRDEFEKIFLGGCNET